MWCVSMCMHMWVCICVQICLSMCTHVEITGCPQVSLSIALHFFFLFLRQGLSLKQEFDVSTRLADEQICLSLASPPLLQCPAELIRVVTCSDISTEVICELIISYLLIYTDCLFSASDTNGAPSGPQRRMEKAEEWV